MPAVFPSSEAVRQFLTTSTVFSDHVNIKTNKATVVLVQPASAEENMSVNRWHVITGIQVEHALLMLHTPTGSESSL